MTGSMIEIYIGAPIFHESERKLLSALHDHITTTNLSCIVLANLEFEGRQFDFVVLTPSGVHVVDAKSVSSPVKGDINGSWHRLLPNEQWGYYKNGYHQVLDCKNLLRNAMPGISAGFFPEAHVVFVDCIPEGSNITEGDFKASVTDTAGFLRDLEKIRKNPWPLERWRDFAEGLKLTKVELHEAFDDSDSELIQRYRYGFIQDYQPEAERLIPEDDTQVQSMLFSAKNGTGCFISGPSGCGKTLIAKNLAVELSKEGSIVFFLSAKIFNGSFSDALRTEVSLVSDSNYRTLLKVLSKRGVNPYFVIDGLNEMPKELTKIALRGLKVLARRYNAKIIATSQVAPPSSLSALETFEVSEPSSCLKKRIAENVSPKLSPAAIQVLSSINSGLEAEVVGKMQSDLGKSSTRLILLDQYIRFLLGKNARTGSALLRCFSTWLIDRIFSVAETEFDIYMIKNGFTLQNCDDVFDTNILVIRAGRVSFSHEMYYYVSASHTYVFDASEDPKAIGKKLNTPVYRLLAIDVISAIEDKNVCTSILEYIDNSRLLADAADGILGEIAEQAALSLLKQASIRVTSDITFAKLSIVSNEGAGWVDWEVVRTEFLPEEKAQFHAIGLRAVRGTGIEDYLSLCRFMDAHLKSENTRLREFARDNKISLRSESFRLAYLGFGSKISFSIVSGGTRGYLEPTKILQEFDLTTLSSGELYFVLECSRVSDNRNKVWFAEEIIDIITNRFRYEPYHVKLSILDNACLDKSLGRDIIDRLIDAIEKIDPNTLGLFGGSTILDTLEALGALEKEAESQREYVKNEVKKALDGDENEHSYEQALGVYGAIYDHPFCHIYGEEVSSLPLDTLHELYRRALQAPSAKQSFSLTMLAEEIAQLDDSRDDYIFNQFAGLPTKNHFLPQYEVAAFVLAVRFLARHKHPLPPVEINDDSDLCFDALRKIIYALQSQLSGSTFLTCNGWRDLEKCPLLLVISCLKEVGDAMSPSGGFNHQGCSRIFPPINFLDVSSKELLLIIRNFVALGEPAKTRYDHDDDNATGYAFYIIGKYGDRSDLIALRDLIDSPKTCRRCSKRN